MGIGVTTTLAGGGASASSSDVVVLGAGVVGVCTAYALARRGLSVTLIDREAGPACRASFANGAQLSYAYADTLASPALVKKLPALMLGADPLFRLKVSLDPDFLGWSLAFLRNASAERHKVGTLENLVLALESRIAMHELLALYPLSFRYVRAGKMHLYFDQAALRTAREMVELKRSLGAVQHILSASEAQTIEPALCGSSGLTGVVYSPDDEVGDPHLFCTAMVQLLTERFGMRTIFGMTAQNLAQDQSGVAVLGTDGTRVRAKALVVALGIGAPAFLRRLGLRVSIQPLKGYSFTTAHGHAAPRISITDTVRKLVFCDLGGRMRVAGGAELGEWGLRMRPGRLERLVRAARRSLPEAADYERLDSRWAELRPMSSSSVPIIARARPGLIMNIGHGMLGWTLAMGSAERAAKLVLQELRDLSARHHVVAQPS